MPFISLIPVWLRYVLVVAVVGWLAYMLFDFGRTVGRQSCELDVTRAAVKTSEGNRAKEGATNEARGDAADDHTETIRQISDQRDAAAVAAERLRKQLAAAQRLANGCASGDTSAEQSRQAVASIGAVLAACEAEYRYLGRAAAEHLAAGQHCEADYDALTAAVDAPASGVGQ